MSVNWESNLDSLSPEDQRFVRVLENLPDPPREYPYADVLKPRRNRSIRPANDPRILWTGAMWGLVWMSVGAAAIIIGICLSRYFNGY